MTSEIFNEIRTTIAQLSQQLDSLERRLAELEAPEVKTVEIESISMDGDMPSLEDLPVEAEPEEDMPILEQEAISVEMIDIPMDDIPEQPVEQAAPEAPAPVIEDMPELTMEEEQESLHRTTVKDRFEAAENYRWLKDIPGGHVNNIISAISLNDRVLLIGQLFKEDPMLFNTTLSALNGMETFDQALDYVSANFPDWNLGSDVVYRLMMAVRRKLS